MTASRLLIILLLLAGCAGAPERMVEPKRIRQMLVEIEQEVNSDEARSFYFCVRHILSVWEEDFGQPSIGGTIRISLNERVRVGQRESPFPPWSDDPWFTITRPGQSAYGWYIASEKLIYIAARTTLPSLYHELCHMNLAPRDIHHEDPRWDAWNQRRNEIDKDLREMRCHE